MDPVNAYDVELSRDDDDPKGYEAGYVRLGPLLGSERLGATIYELEQGNSNCPYHYEYGTPPGCRTVSFPDERGSRPRSRGCRLGR